jgi:molecular chaperone GrpE
VTRSRRTDHSARRGEPLGSSPGTRGAPSEDPRGIPPKEPDEARGNRSEEREARPESTPLVDEGRAEGHTPGEEPSAHVGDHAGESEVERARAEAAEHLADLQRLKAEFDNYRKRVLREQTQAVELAAGPLVMRLLEVLDEFELALTAAERVERTPDMDRFVHGVEIVYAKLMEILKAEGLARIEAEGARFDPELHEALLQGGGPQEGEPYVEDVLRQGYALKGRVIRPAGVKVARR